MSNTNILRFNNSNRQFYTELKKRVDAYFKENNISKNGNFNLYEDDGSTDSYRSGNYSFTNISFTPSNDSSMQLTITPDGKLFSEQVKERVWIVQFINCNTPLTVSINGNMVNSQLYDTTNRVLSIATGKWPVGKSMIISVN